VKGLRRSIGTCAISVLEAVLLLTLPSTLNMIHSLPPFLSFVAFAVASEAVLSCLVAASVDRSACG